MMNYYRFLLLLILVCSQFACDRQLDLASDGRVSLDGVFSDYNQVRGYLNSCYGHSPAPYMDRASFSDEAHDADDVTPGSSFINWYGGNANTQNFNCSDGNPWGQLYTGIRKCNVFIDRIPHADVYAGELEKAGWKAQAHTLRALYYLQLIKRYGAVPLVTKPLAIDHDFSADRKASFSEVVSFILEDCRAALAVPAERGGFSWDVYDNQYGIMTRGIAYAIMSQAVTFAASPLWSDGAVTWEMATQITGEALAECLANGYELFEHIPANNTAINAYDLYFLTGSDDQRSFNKETIYQLGSRMEVWRYAGLPSNAGMERAGPSPSQELVDSYEMINGETPILGYQDEGHLTPILNPTSGYDPARPYANRDPRFYASIYYNGAPRYLDVQAGKVVESYVGGADQISSTNRKHTRTGYYLRKFNHHRSNIDNNADGAIALFRLAELYLNFAEAAYQHLGPDNSFRLGDFSMSARDAVNNVRVRVGMPGFRSGMSKQEFERKYRNERRIELAFEEHRFFDVRRWDILGSTDRVVTGMRITRMGNDYAYERMGFRNRASSTEKYLRYPIPQEEVNKMAGLTGQDWQNPGWLD